MVGIRQYLRPEVAASAIAHLSIVALVFVYAQGRPLGTIPSQSVTIDIVTPDEIENKAEPTPPKSPQWPTDLNASTKPAETPALPPATLAAEEARQAAQSNRKNAAVGPQPVPSPAQSQPQAKTPQPISAPAAAPQASSAYLPPEPDVTVKYHIPLGLPEALPPAVLSADTGDKKGDPDNAAARTDVNADMIAAFRARIRQCAKLPSSLSPSDDLMIKLRILMRPDGRLAAEPMVKEGTAALKAVDLKDGAVAALAACQPYTMLPPEKYNEWKVIDVTFTPRDFSS
jgi:hypothetical protein